jgi:hypothetical protein
MKKSTKAKLAAGGMGFTYIASLASGTMLASCKNETTPDPTCDCQNKIHPGDQPCGCGLADCTCRQTIYHLAHGITLEDENGFLSDEQVGSVEEMLRRWALFVPMLTIAIEGLDDVKITIIPGNNYGRAGNTNTIMIGINNFTSVSDINDILGLLFKLMTGVEVSKANSNILLPNGRTTTVGEVIALGRQFSDAKRIVRGAFGSQYQAQI